MGGFVTDSDGKTVARIADGELFDTEGRSVGSVRHNNVYDRNGKFIFHLQPAEGEEAAGRMTVEAVWKLFHPKPSANSSSRP